jgi:uncharacterized membrane protein YhaH (DUF805 family)
MNWVALYFSPHGRISRKVYWLASLPLLPLFLMVDPLMTRDVDAATGVSALIVFAALLVPNLMLGIKRFHDRDKSGWFMLLNLVPLIGPVWLLVELGFLHGSAGTNRFGPDPLAVLPDAVMAS